MRQGEEKLKWQRRVLDGGGDGRDRGEIRPSSPELVVVQYLACIYKYI